MSIEEKKKTTVKKRNDENSSKPKPKKQQGTTLVGKHRQKKKSLADPDKLSDSMIIKSDEEKKLKKIMGNVATSDFEKSEGNPPKTELETPRTYETILDEMKNLSSQDSKKAETIFKLFTECCRNGYLTSDSIIKEFFQTAKESVGAEKSQLLLRLYKEVRKSKNDKKLENTYSKMRVTLVKETESILARRGLLNPDEEDSHIFSSANQNKERDFKELLTTFMINIDSNKDEFTVRYDVACAAYLWAMIRSYSRRQDNFIEMSQMIERSILEVCIKPDEKYTKEYSLESFTDALLKGSNLKEVGKYGWLYTGVSKKLSNAVSKNEQLYAEIGTYRNQIEVLQSQLEAANDEIANKSNEIDWLQQAVASAESDKVAAEKRVDFEQNQAEKGIDAYIESIKESLSYKIGLEMEGIEVLSEDVTEDIRNRIIKRLNRIKRILNEIGE